MNFVTTVLFDRIASPSIDNYVVKREQQNTCIVCKTRRRRRESQEFFFFMSSLSSSSFCIFFFFTALPLKIKWFTRIHVASSFKMIFVLTHLYELRSCAHTFTHILFAYIFVFMLRTLEVVNVTMRQTITRRCQNVREEKKKHEKSIVSFIVRWDFCFVFSSLVFIVTKEVEVCADFQSEELQNIINEVQKSRQFVRSACLLLSFDGDDIAPKCPTTWKESLKRRQKNRKTSCRTKEKCCEIYSSISKRRYAH